MLSVCGYHCTGLTESELILLRNSFFLRACAEQGLVNNNTLALYLKRQAGYRVGMFGKYLNNCPNKPPPGFDAWFANGIVAAYPCL